MCSEDALIVNTVKYESCQEIFDTAGQIAIDESKSMGLSVTYVQKGNIVKEAPDGTIEVLGKAPEKVVVKEKVIRLINTNGKSS